MGKGQTADAVTLLKRATTIGGQLDHPLTPLVLLELGQAAFAAGNYEEAGPLLQEAGYSAFTFNDQDVLEESFRAGLQVYLALHPGGRDIFPPLPAAIAWSRTRGQELRARLLLLAAENDALLNFTAPAAACLSDARSVIGRRDMGSREIGARLNYLSAMVAYQQGKQSAGDQFLADALTFEKTASKRALQIHLADEFATALQTTPANRKLTLPFMRNCSRSDRSRLGDRPAAGHRRFIDP